MLSVETMAKSPEILCPWCGEFDLPNTSRLPQLERLADGRSWLCNTCSHVFTLSESLGDGVAEALHAVVSFVSEDDEETVH